MQVGPTTYHLEGCNWDHGKSKPDTGVRLSIWSHKNGFYFDVQIKDGGFAQNPRSGQFGNKDVQVALIFPHAETKTISGRAFLTIE